MYIDFLLLVRILAGVIILAGMLFAVWPATMKRVVTFVIKGKRLYGVAAIRILAGIVLLLAAGDGRANRAILSVLGVIILLAGIMQLIMSLEKQKSIANWMVGRSEILRRLLGIAAVLIGGLMLTATFVN